MQTKKPARFSAHFRTDDLPADRRLGIVRDALMEKSVAFDIGPLHDRQFFADMYVRELPGLEVTMGHIRAKAHRSKAITRDGNDDLLFTICFDGHLQVQQRDSETIVAPGTSYIGWCAEPIVFDTDVRHGISLRIPRDVIAPLVPTIDDLIGRQLGENPELVRLIGAYTRSLENEAFYETPALSRVAVGHVHDLVALAIGTELDVTRMLNQRSVRSVRTATLKADIAQHLGSPDLDASGLAKRHGLSPRYVRKLFEENGTTLSAFVLEQRLQMARRLLLSPLHSTRPISTIAYDVGFGDISYFNRCFRARFGMTPTDFRTHGE